MKLRKSKNAFDENLRVSSLCLSLPLIVLRSSLQSVENQFASDVDEFVLEVYSRDGDISHAIFRINVEESHKVGVVLRVATLYIR
jgi:hypothetical protein